MKHKTRCQKRIVAITFSSNNLNYELIYHKPTTKKKGYLHSYILSPLLSNIYQGLIQQLHRYALSHFHTWSVIWYFKRNVNVSNSIPQNVRHNFFSIEINLEKIRPRCSMLPANCNGFRWIHPQQTNTLVI